MIVLNKSFKYQNGIQTMYTKSQHSKTNIYKLIFIHDSDYDIPMLSIYIIKVYVKYLHDTHKHTHTHTMYLIYLLSDMPTVPSVYNSLLKR